MFLNCKVCIALEIVSNLCTHVYSLFMFSGVLNTTIQKCGVGGSAEPFCEFGPPSWVQFLICQVSCTELSRLVFAELVLNLTYVYLFIIYLSWTSAPPIQKCGVGRSAEPFCDIEPVSVSMFEQPNAIYLNSKFHFLSKRLTADVHMFALFFCGVLNTAI